MIRRDLYIVGSLEIILELVDKLISNHDIVQPLQIRMILLLNLIVFRD